MNQNNVSMGVVLFLAGACGGSQGHPESRVESQPSEQPCAAPPARAETPWMVHIPNDWRTCEQDADCTIVEVECSACCNVQPLAKEHEKTFYAKYEKVCDGYSGDVCDCEVPRETPRCREGYCVAEL